MKKHKPIITKNAAQLSKLLGLGPSAAAEMDIHNDLNDKIISIVQKHGLTHAQVAKLSGTSRTRITAIMNRNTFQISTDLLLRILGSLGVRAKISFLKAA